MNHLGDTNKMVRDTPSVCPFCGSYVATLDDGKSCGDSEGNWVAFRCLTSWHRGYHDPRKLQSKTCETVERHKLYDRIKQLEADYQHAIDCGGLALGYAAKGDFESANEVWLRAKEAK
jgi:hypothetical protein